MEISRLLAFQLGEVQSNCSVPKIRHPETNLVETNPKKIAHAFAKYYQQLYKGHEHDSKEEKIKDFFFLIVTG